MPTIKVRRLNFDANDTFRALSPYIVFVSQHELTIHDNDLYNTLDQVEKIEKLITSLKEENTRLEEKQIAMPIVIAERDKLREQIAEAQKESRSSFEYKDQSDKYKSEIIQLKSQEGKQLSQIQELNDKIVDSTKKIQSLEKDNQTLQKDKQVLQNERKDIEVSIKELQDSLQEREDIKTFFSKWGTFLSLKKDIQIIQFFLSMPGQDIRQKTVINTFTSWDKSTVRNHLYRLLQKGILKETGFRGSYRLNKTAYIDMAKDVDEIASIILGRDLYEMALSQHEQKK